MRDLLALGVFSLLAFLSLRSPFTAYLMWGWAGLAAMDVFLFGFMSKLAYVQFFAMVCLTLLILGKDSEKSRFDFNRTTVLFLIFGVHGFFSASLAYPGLDRNWTLYTNLLKTFLFCILMPMLATSRFRIHAMVVMLALVISLHSGAEGLKFIVTGGAHRANGNAKLGDNNHFALTILMGIPLLFYLFQYSKKRLMRYGFLLATASSILTVIASTSRGGLGAMVAIASWIVLTGRRKLVGSLIIIMATSLVLVVAPASWFEKMDTISAADEDASFMGRVTAWKRASAIAIENPVFGGGFHAGQAPVIFSEFRYRPGLLGFVPTPDVDYAAASHSIYFEVMGDLGFVGLLIFLIIIANAFLTNIEIQKIVKEKSETLMWAGDLSNMLSASLIAFIIGGALLSAAYLELPYILMMLLEVVKQHIKSLRVKL